MTGIIPTPEPRLARDWKGGFVRTRREMRNAFMANPAGTLMEVDTRTTSVGLISLPCPCCGVRSRISFKGPETPHLVEWVGRRAEGIDVAEVAPVAAERTAA